MMKSNAVVVTVLAGALLSLADARLPPFLSKVMGKKPKYTPLVFFTVPKDIIPECDAMESVVSEVEGELGVRVERMDVLRDPAAGAVLGKLTTRGPPFLYHRESLQTVSVPGAKPRSEDEEETNAYVSPISKDRVRAWAKGRCLAAMSVTASGSGGGGLGPRGRKPTVLSQEENAIDQKELMDELYMSPSQKSGKEAIEQRTAEKAQQAKERRQ